MARKMAPLKKPQNIPRLHLALNPLKSKDVLAVLAERNQAIVPIGAWVEPASPHSSEIPANTSACVIEEELKEQLRKKKEALKHFQRQVKRRVNQHIRLRQKQQLQRSYEAAEKEGSIAMQSSDPVHLTSKKRTSVFPNNMNAASRISWLPLNPEDGENHNELFQQQAQALSQTMKQVRHQLASFKTMGEKKSSVLPDGKISVPIQEKLDSVGCVSIMTDERWRENLLWGDQQDLLSEIKDKPFNRVQKVQFKNPLFDVMQEKEVKQLHFQDILSEAQDYLREVQSDLSETLGDLPRVQSAESEAQNLEPDTQAFELEVLAGELKTQSDEPETQADELETQADELETQAGEPRAQAAETKTHGVILKAQSIELEEGSIMMDAQDFLPQNQDFLPEIQGVQPKDQDFLLKDEDVLPKDQNILPKCQDQDIIPKYQETNFRQPSPALTTARWRKELPTSAKHCLLPVLHVQPSTRDQLDQQEEEMDEQEKVNLKQPASISILIGRGEREVFPLDVHPDPHRHQDQASNRYKKVRFKEPYCAIMDENGEEDLSLADSQYLPPKLQEQTFIRDQNMFLKQPSCFLRENRVRQELLQENPQYVTTKIQDQTSLREQNMFLKQSSSFMREETVRQESPQESHQYVTPKIQDQASPGEQSLYLRKQSYGTAERKQEDCLLDGRHHLQSRQHKEVSSRRQVYDTYQSGLNTEIQDPLMLQSGVDQEEEKKVLQKQYLRYTRHFMDFEREQVKEQERQKEHKKKIEKLIKKEEERYAEEQRILNMTCHEVPYSGEKMSEILAQLKLEDIKGEREKQKQREKEYLRYVDALRAQIQEKMKLYNITLPPLCCCGPDFWDAHPDTCANNCIFYKNHRAYTRALHSVISSCDIPEGHSTLQTAIHNFASVYRRTLKNL